MDNDGTCAKLIKVSASKKWLTLAEVTCNWLWFVVVCDGLWGGSKRWTFSETMDFFRNDGLFQTIVTLPSVLSAVCIVENLYLAASLLKSNKDPCPTISIHKSEIKIP